MRVRKVLRMARPVKGHASFGEASAVKHVLAVDDDPATRAMIRDYLADRGFRVSMAADVPQAWRGSWPRAGVDLVVLDLKLAGEDGLELLRELRCEFDLPVIVLTGHRREEVDRVVGLELGADDYLTKPFSLRELLARSAPCCAASRRARGTRRAPPAEGKGDALPFRRLGAQPAHAPADARRGRARSAHRGEFSLLTAFLRAPGQVLSRDQLLAASRLHDDEVFDRSIDVQILRLRRKLEANPSEPALIRTERGVGYVFAAPVQVL